MNTSNVSVTSLLGGIVVGVLMGAGAVALFSAPSEKASLGAKDKPLYWVAPMDPNYRRAEPGLSPMGMDLVPVYKGGDGHTDTGMGAGTVSISPHIVNNLGVRSANVEKRPLQNKIVTVAYVKYDEDNLIHIHPRVSGWVEELNIKAAGDPVKKGEALYALYSPELVSAQEEFVLALNGTNNRLVKGAMDRLLALQISQQFINELKRTKRVKQRVTFYSPQSGVVDNLNIREGFFVEPGTTMLSIGALDNVWVEAEIFERQAPLVKLNDAITMVLDYLPGRTWKGKVDYIYPTIDDETRTARARIRIENSDGALKPNMFAQVTIHSKSDASVVVVPHEALIRTGDQNRVVLSLGEGRFKSIAVTSGRSDGRFIEILEGLKEGDRIVTSAQFLLDSESSKDSDFKRIDHDDVVPNVEHTHHQNSGG
ncbi:MAG: efflux RND transporter periplasmic adaptor subunit [Agarilytica sp.]